MNEDLFSRIAKESLRAIVEFTLDEDFGGINTNRGFRGCGKSYLMKEKLLQDVDNPLRSAIVYRSNHEVVVQNNISSLNTELIKDRMFSYEEFIKLEYNDYINLEVVYIDGVTKSQCKMIEKIGSCHDFEVRGFISLA